MVLFDRSHLSNFHIEDARDFSTGLMVLKMDRCVENNSLAVGRFPYLTSLAHTRGSMYVCRIQDG